MPTVKLHGVLGRVGVALIDSVRTDGQLLEAFLTHREEPAFRTLLWRHGPMVFGVCRRLLRNTQDAEDAFQATFLVLVRKGRALAGRDTIGNWLYGVAHHTALKARAASMKRRAKESRALELSPRRQEAPPDDLDLRPILDRELSRLPDKYREAVVLCDLEGRPRRESAARLGIPEGTLSSRLTTAHQLLARRLSRHRLALSAGATVLLAGGAPAAVPAALVHSTSKAAALVAAGHAAGAVLSAHIAALTEGVLQGMLISKCKNVLAIAVVVGFVAVGAGGASVAVPGPAPAAVRAADPPPAEKPKDPAPPAERSAEIGKLVKDLGSDEFARREAACKELEKLGEEALPALETALAGTSDLEIKRRLEALIDPLRKKVRDRQAEKLLAQATRGGIDVLVEYLVLKGADATDEDWGLLQKVVTSITEKAGTPRKFDLERWPIGAGAHLVNGKAILDGDVNGLNIVNGAAVVRGSVTHKGGLVNAVVFANGDVTLEGTPVNTLLVCDGNVTLGRGVNCVVVASGSIKAGDLVGCVLAACGPVKAGGINTRIREEETVPLEAVKFFATAQLGVEAVLADGKVRVEKVEAGTPLAKAGLQKGDVVAALGATKVNSVGTFRKALRRGLAEGKAVLKVQRGDKVLELTARLLD